MLARDWGRRTFRHRQELLLRHIAAVLCQQTLRINFYAGGIRSEGVSTHVGVGLFDPQRKGTLPSRPDSFTENL